MKKNVGISVIVATILAGSIFIGCGGSGSSSSVSGKAIDDYISGATVCIDSNQNGSCDTGETSTTTDNEGGFSFPSTPSFPLVLNCTNTNSCKDVGTGQIFKGRLTAPAGSMVLNALTTLIQDYVANNPGSSATTVEQNLKEKLGLPSGIDLKNYDPVAESGSTDGQKVLAIQTKVQLLMTGISKVADNDKEDDVANALAKNILEAADATAGKATLVNGTAIKNIIDDVKPTIGGTSNATNVANVIIDFVDNINDTVGREDAAKVTKVLEQNSDNIESGTDVDVNSEVGSTTVDVEDQTTGGSSS
jgi:hypothetical protein